LPPSWEDNVTAPFHALEQFHLPLDKKALQTLLSEIKNNDRRTNQDDIGDHPDILKFNDGFPIDHADTGCSFSLFIFEKYPE